MRKFAAIVAIVAVWTGAGFALGTRYNQTHTKPVIHTVDQVESYNDGFLDGKSDGLATCGKH